MRAVFGLPHAPLLLFIHLPFMEIPLFLTGLCIKSVVFKSFCHSHVSGNPGIVPGYIFLDSRSRIEYGTSFTGMATFDTKHIKGEEASHYLTCAVTRLSSSWSSLTPRTSRSVLRKARTIVSMSLVLLSFLPPLNLAVWARFSR
jgi:hypothetical protein